MRDQFHRSPVNRPVVPAPSMNSDKQNNGMPAKPFKPSLSAAFRTAANKPSYPLTPRLAPAGGHQTPKKTIPPDTAPPPFTTRREDVNTPGSTPLSSNVTPRSGSRISRRDGPVPSPENTPVVAHTGPQLSRPTLPVATAYTRSERSPVRAGLRPEAVKATAVKSISTDGLGLRAPVLPHSSSESLSSSPKFFRADDARSSAGSHEAESRPSSFSKQSQASTFLYADGTLDTDSQTDDPNRAGPRKRRSTGSSRLPGGAKSQAVLSPRLRTAQLADSASRSSPESNLQPSPNIEESFESRLSTSPSAASPGLAQPSQPLPRPSHRKSCSLDSTTQVVSPRGISRRVTPISSPPLLAEALDATPDQSHISPQIVTNILIDPISNRDISYTVPQSPIKLEGPNAFGDGVLNARTERKILDLEISNSSLLAINRTLERELRKQNAELRRFRRLSRSGRLSMTTASIRSISGGALSVVSETGDISELSSNHSNDEMSDESDNDSFADDGTNSPSSLADHDARHRASDEKRFMLDLAKHQELLVDSQKLNQSLKRCLGLTEELIKEGKKALEYNIHVNDVEVGGRVLAPEEIEDELANGRGLLSPAAEVEEALAFNVSGEALSSTSQPDDF